jgi:hypothetical protein
MFRFVWTDQILLILTPLIVVVVSQVRIIRIDAFIIVPPIKVLPIPYNQEFLLTVSNNNKISIIKRPIDNTFIPNVNPIIAVTTPTVVSQFLQPRKIQTLSSDTEHIVQSMIQRKLPILLVASKSTVSSMTSSSTL